MKYPNSDLRLSSVEKRMEEEAEREINERIKRLENGGYRAHSKRLMPTDGMKDYIYMDRWMELNTVISLMSEPFDNKEHAEHFAAVFNDCFLAEAVCEQREDGKYWVFSGWLYKHWVISYSINFGQKFAYFMFANWS